VNNYGKINLICCAVKILGIHRNLVLHNNFRKIQIGEGNAGILVSKNFDLRSENEDNFLGGFLFTIFVVI